MDILDLSILVIISYELYEQKYYLYGYLVFYYINYLLNALLNTDIDEMSNSSEGKYGYPSFSTQSIIYSITYLFNLTENNLIFFICLVILLISVLNKKNELTYLQILSGAIFGIIVGYTAYLVCKFNIENYKKE